VKTWISIPVALLSTILGACGRKEDSTSDVKKDSKRVQSPNHNKSLDSISSIKKPSDCGFSNSSIKDKD
jgi:hypothetical protein